MAERHAQRHWLKLQAEKAVARAMEDGGHPGPVVLMEVDRMLSLTGKIGDDIQIANLKRLRDVAIADAAKALITSELYHREIVRRGGKV